MANPNMTFRALTPSGDWVFGSGLGAYATGQAAIGLLLVTSVRMWAGDAFFALNGNGVAPWVNWLGLTNTGRQQQLNAALQTLLFGCYGVMSVTAASVDINPNTRTFSATYSVQTIYSQQITNTIQIASGQSQLIFS